MTSGQFQSYPIDKIYVEREERQRRDLGDLKPLAESIRQVGLINPLVIERDGKLRAGERRLNAIKMIGWTHVSIQFTDEIDRPQLQLIELEENIRREQLSWQDECRAVERYHEMRSKEDGWNARKTAEALLVSEQTVGAKLGVARELREGNVRVMAADRFSTARGITERAKERKAASTLAAIETVEGDTLERQVPLVNGDFIQWQRTYQGPKFNFIHCDFPYGIGADKAKQGGAVAEVGGYADTFGVFNDLCNALEAGMENVVAESAHLMFWFSMEHYAHTFLKLFNMGWEVNRFPLIWHKSDNIGLLPDPSRGPRRIYETCFMASRGDRKIVRAVSNIFSAPTTMEIHMSEKPVGMLRKFMEMFVDENTTMLDPTCGSANAVKAAAALRAFQVLGIERDTEFYNLAKEKFYGEDNI